jgi:hypothetical protein
LVGRSSVGRLFANGLQTIVGERPSKRRRNGIPPVVAGMHVGLERERLVAVPQHPTGQFHGDTAGGECGRDAVAKVVKPYSWDSRAVSDALRCMAECARINRFTITTVADDVRVNQSCAEGKKSSGLFGSVTPQSLDYLG